MSSICTDEVKIDEILTRGVHELFTKEELKQKLMSGKKLHLKLGTDVTGPNLHLGHTVAHRKIRDFQELGHDVTFIIGDFTTLVGDHSDKVDMRTETSADEIKRNEQRYTEQFFKTVIKSQTKIRHNSEWLKELKFNDIIGLARQFTIAQMLERETFMLRYTEKKPIGLDEFMYPLMQGYDSVALNCDVEFGGTDQTFNLLAGRKIMQLFNQTPQCAVVTRLLTGSDGKPMGKSLMNFIPILDNPEDMYGKVMSIVDEVIFEYFELVTRVPMDEIAQMKQEVEHGANPMEFKKRLAKEITAFYHDEKTALQAQEYFERTVQRGERGEKDTLEINIPENTTLLEALKTALGGEVSSGEMKRVIAQNGVSINDQIQNSMDTQIRSGDTIKFGKRKYIKIK
ncbi:MAG: tyrosine--tRNA ligase [Patescibacteria group bacterium]|jgi:tyrosyl-tRNA synthetase